MFDSSLNNCLDSPIDIKGLKNMMYEFSWETVSSRYLESCGGEISNFSTVVVGKLINNCVELGGSFPTFGYTYDAVVIYFLHAQHTLSFYFKKCF